MMTHFYKLKVNDVRRETADCVSVAFEVPLALKNEFGFIQGQYLTFKLSVTGEELRRSYSICSSPLEKDMRVAVKRVKGGRVSNFINDQFKPGLEVEVMKPMGGFHSPMNASHKKQYVLFAGGSGITPMLSILKTVLTAEPHSTLKLFYGNLNEEATIFKKQLDDLALQHPSRLSIQYVFEKPVFPTDELYKGLLSEEKITELLDRHTALSLDSEFFICGPLPMMDNAKAVLEKKQIERVQIHIEYFGTAANEPTKVTTALMERIQSKITVIQYGMETIFDLASDGKTILDAAIEAGADAPFACKGAVCATCRGKVIEGKASMDKNFALTDSEVAEGYILTCQSHPLTPVVKVDYDG
jgi:ring-1,2-phenylacetyl-CoA epoxidase subunit PaaE